jgi:DNA invertase Pin-like site-specific DNA recombinase
MVYAYSSLGVRYYGYQEQEEGIFDYSVEFGLSIESELIEELKLSDNIDERFELREFFSSMTAGDHFLVYRIDAFTHDVADLTKIMYCLFKRGVTLHLCKDGIVIDKDTSSLIIMNLLEDVRERRKEKHLSTGRPKGTKSRSRFDEQRGEIITLLNEELSVSDIARKLDVSRSSLKDYINSRNLKTMAKRWQMYGRSSYLLNKEVMHERYAQVMSQKKCKLAIEATN